MTQPASCTRCGHPGSEHGREPDLILGVVGSKRELCLECPGYVFDTEVGEVDGYPRGKAWHRFKEAE